MVRVPSTEAICCVCMKRKKCTTERLMGSGMWGGPVKVYDNFLYSEEHRGWLCKPCVKKLEKSGVAVVASGQRDFFS